MRQVRFDYKCTDGKTVVKGIITVSDSGKVSTSFPHIKYLRLGYRDESAAKSLAKDIISSKYEHESITYDSAKDENVVSIIKIIKAETSDVKDKYLKKVEQDTEDMWLRDLDFKEMTDDQWFAKYKIPVGTFAKYENWHYYPDTDVQRELVRSYRNMRSFRQELRDRLKLGFLEILKKELASAEMHYESSTYKLAERIHRNDILVEKMVVTRARVGVNLEVTFTDGVSTVRAWTIIAEGEIKKAHYRYLIK